MTVLLLLVSLTADDGPLTVGSKTFTESVVLGEIATLALRQSGLDARHQQEMGGSRILLEALERGQIDVYPEYTGTLALELFSEQTGGKAVSLERLRALLAERGLRMTPPLGFDNTYALGMRQERARKLGIQSISDLAAHPALNFGFSNEFLDRGDGWPALRDAYQLPQRSVRGLDHDLAYRALEQDSLDLIDLYATDAEIAYYDLFVLDDDRRFFPEYEAVFLYRADAGETIARTLDSLAGSIDQAQMTRLNAEVKLEGKSEREVAAAKLGLKVRERQSAWLADFWQRTREHLVLTGISLSLAIVVAIPLGVLAAKLRPIEQLVLSVTGIMQTIPSLAMFVFMIPLFGVGAKPAIAALLLYSLLPIVRNTHAGLVGIAPELRLAARAIGLDGRSRLLRIELPLALPSILAGIKIAAVINVGTATLGALIGAGGYGQPILTGIRLDDIGLIMQGAIPAAVLALLVQGVFEGIERVAVPRPLRAG